MHGNLIAGEWVNGTAVPNINPSDTSDVIGDFASGTAQDATDAIAAARAAFDTWQFSAPLERHAILSKTAAELMARRDELGALLAREEGKTRAEATAEVGRAAQIFDFFAGEALRLTGEAGASTRPGIEVAVTREPAGVVGLITPWNFPIAIPAWKIAPALAHGNTVVFKPASLVPASAHALVDIIHRAGAPAGVVNLVMGPGRSVGQTMIEGDLDAISFTGSTGTGAMIAMESAKRQRRFQLEMGGKNPMVVLDDADLDTAVRACLDGAYFSTGQRCTASSRLIVTEGIHDRFVAALRDAIAGLNVGHALNDGTQIGPVVDQSQLDSNLEYIAKGEAEGAAREIGGEVLSRETAGFFQRPALFTGCTNDMTIAREEIFGPVAAVIRVRDYDEALRVANDTPFGLTSGICTASLKHASDFRRKSQAGMVTVNLPTAGVDFHTPFGGRKGSSFGPREQGAYAREFYSTVKTAYINAG
ncbi:aldehyde dehydrogenase family protein [Thalassospira lucentensis]|uniref:aldehyde dehydrogenase family protein n=1 Tax=Thalassospira lucentensis TaxID=168935 RepID=UPI0003B67FCA|nr:aldehyde dehydrogenase family protein [Thalassospira lucentensis]RCK21744.1 aldehyde dehydrogenase [Thalassospira lucentensis MCCC 1A00383 = DSM 14000]